MFYETMQLGGIVDHIGGLVAADGPPSAFQLGIGMVP